MQTTEKIEKIPIARRGERDARISEQQRETGSEGRPQDHHRNDCGYFRPVNLLNHNRDDEIRERFCGFGRREFAPWNYAEDRKVDGQIDHRDRDYADDDRTGDCPSGIFDLVADVAHVIITKVVVDADPGSRAESEQKSGREIERAW